VTRAERTMLRTLIDRARRTQLEQQGGYGIVEGGAKRHDRWLADGGPGFGASPKAALASKPVSETSRSAPNQRVDVDRARQLRRQGLSYPKIAAELGCTHAAVIWACDEEFRQRRLRQMREWRARKKAA